MFKTLPKSRQAVLVGAAAALMAATYVGAKKLFGNKNPDPYAGMSQADVNAFIQEQTALVQQYGGGQNVPYGYYDTGHYPQNPQYPQNSQYSQYSQYPQYPQY